MSQPREESGIVLRELRAIEAGIDDSIVFPTKYHGDVTLSKYKWAEICAEPERWYYRNNGEKVSTTLVNPDYVRHHKHIDSQFIYYKSFSSFEIVKGIEMETGMTFPRYFAVIVDSSTSRVCTVYPISKPKKGQGFKG